MLGRRVDPERRRRRGRRRPDRRAAGPGALPAQQAGRASSPPRPTPTGARRWSSSCPRSPGCSRSAASTATPRACCCSPTTATSPTASPTRASASTRSTWSRSRATRTAGWSGGSGRASSSTTGSRHRPRSRVLGDHLLRITIHEGRNRQVRRMCEAVGTPVVRLVRTRIGPLTDRTLKPGQWRPLTQDEVRALERATVGQARHAGSLHLRACCPPCPPWRHHRRRRRGGHVHERVMTLLEEMCERNGVDHDDIVSILFTATDDIHSTFPATGGPHARPRRRAADLRPRARHRRRHPALRPGADAPHHRAEPGRAAPRVPRGRGRPPRRPARCERRDRARRAGIVGTGLIGGSIGLALRQRGWHVTGDDRDADRAAARAGARRARRGRHRPRRRDHLPRHAGAGRGRGGACRAGRHDRAWSPTSAA